MVVEDQRLRRIRLGVVFQPGGERIYLCPSLRTYPRTTIAWVRLPFYVPALLAAPLWVVSSRLPKDPGIHLATVVKPGRAHSGTGISTSYPSTTPFGLALGPDLPWEE